MKIKVRYLIILIAFISICLAAGCSVLQKGGQVKGEAKQVVINIGDLGEKIGVPVGDTSRFIPEWAYYAQEWGREEMQRGIEELKSLYDEPENTYILTSSPQPWMTLSFLEALQPLNVLYLYPRPDGVVLDMCELKRVKKLPDYNYDVAFEVVVDGDEVFVNLNSDKPPQEGEEMRGHSFNTDNLCKVVIPEIPSNKHVFVHGKGMYCVMVAVAKSYVKGSKSVSMACREEDYVCSVPFTGERQMGDVKIRTLPNNL